ELVARATHYFRIFRSSPLVTPALQMSWSSSALQTLFHYMKCNQLENQDAPTDHHQHTIQLTPERSFVVLPPLLEWIRVGSAHCLHRFGSSIDSDDVLQAARVLLPGMDCPVRPLRCSEASSFARALDPEKSTLKFKRNLGFQMLESGRADLVTHAAQLLGPDGLDTINEQGLTPLMYACLQGDEGMVQILLQNGAKPDVVVPGNPQKYPCVHPAIRHWTAVSFAVTHKNTAITQLLLESDASVEGSVEINGDNFTHSPLQLASAAGHLEQVCLLLSKGADPYMTTSQNDCFSSKGYYNSFALAASHGHKGVLRKLLEQPHSRRSSDILSLEEMLAEGVDAEPRRRERKPSKSAKNKMSAALQEAMYHSCQHGFLDIVMELRSLGIPWTLYCWTETLKINRQLHRRANLQCLLRDFNSIKLEEDWEEFASDGLVLLFEIFRYSRDEVVSRQLAAIFSSLYGTTDIPEIEVPPTKMMARIDPHFVNNSDMSDVTFIVEGQPFYAHKIVLVTASKRFKSLLSEAGNAEGGSAVESFPASRLLVMEFLYHGNADKLQIASKDILELLAAASFFAVDDLVLHCSHLCSQKLTSETSLTIYRYARTYSAPALLNYCHAYFLANFTDLLNQNESFRKLLRGNRPHLHDTLSMMQDILTAQIQETYGMKNTSV
ncbi:putative ankyrin repeat and BTB/POZ domain-containing protein BTBD11-like, partial [Apostichopus japonicus]